MSYAPLAGMKNVSFIAGPKNGGFVHARMSSMHHSAEPKMGMAELVFAGVIVMALVGFVLAIAH